MGLFGKGGMSSWAADHAPGSPVSKEALEHAQHGALSAIARARDNAISGFNDFRHKMLDQAHEPSQLFAAAFFFSCMAVFLFPLISAWDLAFDPNVEYWFGRYAFWSTLPIPLGFLFTYVYHTRRGRPRKGLVMGSVIIPCVIFFLVGAMFKFEIAKLVDHLNSVDCQTYEKMKVLSDAVADAQKFYKQCDPADFGSLFHSCPKYQTWRKENDHEETWDYLQYLETNFECTGFCKSGLHPLWISARDRPRDPCAGCVVSVMRTRIGHNALVLMVYSILTLFVFLAWIFIMRPTIIKMSHEMKFRKPLFDRLAEQAGYGSLRGQPNAGSMGPGSMGPGSMGPGPAVFMPAPSPVLSPASPEVARQGSLQSPALGAPDVVRLASATSGNSAPIPTRPGSDSSNQAQTRSLPIPSPRTGVPSTLAPMSM